MKKGYTHFHDGDVLFAKVTPCMENGKMAVARHLEGGLGFGSTEFHVLRPRHGVDSHYIYHFVSSQTFRKEAARHMTGAVGLRRVPTAFLERAEIPLPDINVQRRIVAEIEKQFSRLDEAVANLQRVKANLGRYKAAVLKAAVEGRLVETEASISVREDRRYEPGAELLRRVLDLRRKQWLGRGRYIEPRVPGSALLTRLPDGWAVASLEALTDSNRVICYGILMPKENLVDGVLFVKVRDMRDDSIDLESLHRTSRAIAEKYSRSALKMGDVLLSIRGTYGRVAPVPALLDGGNITQDSARIAVSPVLRADFVAIYLRSEDAQRYFARIARGVAVKGLNIGDLRPMPIPLPPASEQERIVAEVERRLSIVREVEAEVDANLKRAHSLRQAILAKAFSGAPT